MLVSYGRGLLDASQPPNWRTITCQLSGNNQMQTADVGWATSFGIRVDS